MRAAIIAVGSEMLTPSRIDTNSLFLTEKLNHFGIELSQKMVIGDHAGELEAGIRYCLEHVQLLIITGGLGPTGDDLTRECTAAAVGRELYMNEDALARIEARFASMNRTMAPNNRQQGMVIEGAEVLPNPNGTAPGQWLALPHHQYLVLLPGPPGELKPMVEQHLLHRIEVILPPLALATVTFRLTGMGESDLDALIGPVYKPYTNPVTTILAKAGDLTVHLRAQTSSQAESDQLVAELGSKIEALLGNKIYSYDGSPLEVVVLSKLAERNESLAVAESLTAGMLGARFGSVPGASKNFLGGFLTYTDDQKHNLLGVSRETLAAHTAVSEATALEMAVGARARTGASWAVSLTGYAGPDGGTEADPVGTTYIAIAGPDGYQKAHRFRYPIGDRDRIRQFAVQSSLNLLRLALA